MTFHNRIASYLVKCWLDEKLGDYGFMFFMMQKFQKEVT